MTAARIGVLLQLLGQAYDKKAWHGPNLTTALAKVSLDAAAWRPAPGRHCIWELVLHAAYWKYRVWRVIAAEPGRGFGMRGSNFVPRPVEGQGRGEWAAQWAADRAFLDAWHRDLIAAVEVFPARRLDEDSKQNGQSFEGLITGAAAHDLYHAGQVRLLHRLFEDVPRR